MENKKGNRFMKKIYILLLSVFAIETHIVFLLNKVNFKAQTWIANVIGIFCFFLPLQILLFLLGRDENIAPQKRIWLKIIFWFINTCYLAGAITTLTLT